MPVIPSTTVSDPPAAPAMYLLCAFEVRSRSERGDVGPVAVFGGNTDGFEKAAAVLVRAVEASPLGVASGFRLAAVAWFADAELTECKPGCERLVSVYDLAAGTWGEWTAEEKVSREQMGKSKRQRVSIAQRAALTRINTSASNR